MREVEALRETAGSDDAGGGAEKPSPANSTSNVSWRADEVVAASPSDVLSELLIE